MLAKDALYECLHAHGRAYKTLLICGCAETNWASLPRRTCLWCTRTKADETLRLVSAALVIEQLFYHQCVGWMVVAGRLWCWKGLLSLPSTAATQPLPSNVENWLIDGAGGGGLPLFAEDALCEHSPLSFGISAQICHCELCAVTSTGGRSTVGLTLSWPITRRRCTPLS